MRRAALFLLLAGACGTVLLQAADRAPDQRLVRAELRFNGELLLETSTSDDGHPDVDQVWAYLPGLAFRPTPEFAKLLAARGVEGDAFTLERGEKDDWIRLDIAYGGRAELRKLPLRRDGETWKVDADAVQGAAERRWIRRWEAAALYGDKR